MLGRYGVGAGQVQESYGAGAQPCLSCSYCDGARGLHWKLLEEIYDVTLREDVLEGTVISALTRTPLQSESALPCIVRMVLGIVTAM